MDASLLAQQLIVGLTSGSLIALVALGYSMVYGVIGLINFAHGDLFMLGCFFALTLVGISGLGPDSGPVLLLAIPALVCATGLFAALINTGVERAVYRPLRRGPPLSTLVAAIGLSFVFQNIGLLWGAIPLKVLGGGRQAAAPKAFPALVGDLDRLPGALVLTDKDLLVLGVTVPLMLLLDHVVRRTWTGRAMRAVSQDPVAARLMGIDVDRTIAATFFVGGALAGAASVVAALWRNTVDFQMGYTAGLNAFSAAVVGGIGSIPGAVVGGLLIGVVRALSDLYLAAEWTNAVVFGMLILVLVFRPTGLLGTPARDRA